MRTINHHLFSAWTEASAYTLGFWYADGSIYAYRYKDTIRKQFTIVNTNAQIMTIISTILRSKLHIDRPNRPRSKVVYVVKITSNELFDFCYSLVGTTDKTHSTRFPIIPDAYLKHFVRGYFDGDGSIHVKHYKSRHGKLIENLATSFTASKESWPILATLRDWLADNIEMGDKKVIIYTSKDGNHHGSKLVYGQYDTMLLCQWMYDGATIFMERKKAIWDGFDKQKLINSQKYFSNKV